MTVVLDILGLPESSNGGLESDVDEELIDDLEQFECNSCLE